MKNEYFLIFAVITAVLFSGCTNKGNEIRDNGSQNSSGENTGNFPPPAFAVDIDFTTFSGPQFDEEFSNIMFLYPENYLGKTVRLIGQYSGVFDEDSGQLKHYVVVDDPTNCCLRYVEFTWSDGYAPDEYPEKFTVVDVTGVFSTYYEKEIDWNFHFLEVKGISVLH
jgi:hypothetical protein